MKTPILFLIFNRLETTKLVFQKIKEARPEKLYLASDGARENKIGEKELVSHVREWVINNIDWPCEIKKNFQLSNLGCGKHVSSAITWFFSNEPEGIILEDDCVPHKDFFGYCEQLLDRYRDIKKVWHIAGINPLIMSPISESYYFSKRMHCWGWASWADRWEKYTFDLSNYAYDNIKKISTDRKIQAYWHDVLEKMKKHEIDTWDYQWMFKIIENEGLCINPVRNLISNIGEIGTHFNGNNTELNKPTFPILPLNHPEKIELNLELVNKINQLVIIQEKSSEVYKIKLLGFFPILRIKKKKDIIRVLFLGIPLLKIKVFYE